jgi:hypothetical protein
MTGVFACYIRPRMTGVVILLMVMLSWGSGNQAYAQDVNTAMQSFIQAMVNKNSAAISSAFSQQSPWRYQPYEIGTNRRLKPASVTPEKMAHDFQHRTGWYDFFLADPNGYTFRVNFMHSNKWKKRGADTFVAPDSDSGNTYITWRREGERWVIGEIGETTP